MDTLADIFNPWPSYEFDDLYGGIANRDLIVRSRQAIALLRQRLDNLESALARRGLRSRWRTIFAAAGYTADDLCSAWQSYNWST
jgi:hypothetical protein